MGEVIPPIPRITDNPVWPPRCQECGNQVVHKWFCLYAGQPIPAEVGRWLR